MGSGERHHVTHLETTLNAPEGVIWELDWSTGSFTWISAGCERLLGFGRGDWMQRDFWLQRTHPEDIVEAAARLESAAVEGLDQEFEQRMLHADGTVRWVRSVVRVDPGDPVSGLLRGALIDITSHRLTEIAFGSRDSRQDRIFSGVGLLAASVDVSGRIEYVNDSACELLGIPRDELVGREFVELLPETHRDAFRDEHAARMRDDKEAEPIDLPVVTSGGEVRIVHLNAVTLRDAQGAATGAAVAGTDVTEHERAEARYRQQAEEFDVVFRLLRDLYFRLDPNGAVEEYRAPSDAELYVPAEMFLGHKLDEILPSEVSYVLQAESERCRTSGEMTVSEYSLAADGELRDWEARFLPLANDRVAVVVRDITLRKRHEQQLREQRDFLDLLLETLDSGVIVVRGESPPVIQRANRPAARLIGYEPDELVGMTTRVFHRSDAEWARFIGLMQGTLEADSAEAMEVRMRRKDGTEFDAEVVIRGLGLESAERIGIIRDISGRKAAELKVRESEMRFRSIVEEAPFGLHLYDVRGDDLILTAANEAADRILHLSHAPLIGLRLEEAFPEASAAGWPQVYRRVAEEGGTWQSEIPYRDERIMGVFQATVFQTSPGRVAVAFVDITERRAIEHADRMHQLKVSAMAAELASAEDRERRRLAEELHDRVSQALAVTRMHLAAAVDDHGRFDRREFELALHMLEDAIRETRSVTTELYPPVLHELGLGPALRWLSDEFEHKHALRCTVTVTDEDLALGEEGANMMFRAARELLMNVVKHADTHRAWLSLDEMAGSIVLTVADMGRGMTERVNGGAGFGLFSIRERLPHFGGSFEVESSPGKGTRITLSIPKGAL